MQSATQAPDWQKGVASEHAPAHDPQWLGSLARSTHSLPHEVRPEGHVHCPAAHDCPLSHALPHDPQFASSLVRSTHACPHDVSPVAHAAWQLPLAQTRAISQTCPHEPQFFGSVASIRHCPPHAACPSGQVIGGGGMQSPPTLHDSPPLQSELAEHGWFFPPQLATAMAIAETSNKADARSRMETFSIVLARRQNVSTDGVFFRRPRGSVRATAPDAPGRKSTPSKVWLPAGF